VVATQARLSTYGILHSRFRTVVAKATRSVK
jgi:hypothetical protein